MFYLIEKLLVSLIKNVPFYLNALVVILSLMQSLALNVVQVLV